MFSWTTSASSSKHISYMYLGSEEDPKRMCSHGQLHRVHRKPQNMMVLRRIPSIHVCMINFSEFIETY